VIVYIGAIAILIIFALMLTRRDMLDSIHQTNQYAWLSVLVSLGVAGGLIVALNQWQSFMTVRSPLDVENMDNVAALGKALVSPDGFAIPFEVASILLIGALIGAIYVANDQRK